MAVTAEKVKELRNKTGAGVMDCKRALEASGGDLEKATDYLRKKGISVAQQRANRETKEGVVTSYIHPGSKLGVLLEINCETDFVARTEGFQSLAKDMAMQIAATNPLAINREALTPEVIERERQIYVEQAKNQGKPEKVIERIVDGKMEKFFQQVCLLEQPFIKNPDITVSELLTQFIAKVGENITIRRFTRYRLGEGK
ncbi:MAG TPA: translation elongation factor Ts [Candidatus Latescibacteria bacterium]|nr:translation elongation factor Ts [Candidatus Latescibacterota bacterium]